MSKLARMAVDVMSIDFLQSLNINCRAALVALALAAITAVIFLPAPRDAWAEEVPNVDARVVAVNIPGASALAQMGTFLNVPPPGACANPIPTKFPSHINPAQCSTRTGSWLAARRTSAPRERSAWGRKGHSCPSIREEQIS
jgi:hypothetical protein